LKLHATLNHRPFVSRVRAGRSRSIAGEQCAYEKSKAPSSKERHRLDEQIHKLSLQAGGRSTIMSANRVKVEAAIGLQFCHADMISSQMLALFFGSA
jgi:hypothetical protein